MSIANGIGSLLLVVFLFAYYAAYDLVLPIDNNLLPLFALLIVSILSLAAQRYAWQTYSTPAAPIYALASLLMILLLAPLLLAISTEAPPHLAAPDTPLRAMAYNLHNGFNPLGQLDLEALAQVIEAEQVDFVGLQEVSRGWVINGSVDMLSWLAHRLQMTPTFGATADEQWGNAVLSRLPVNASSNHPLPGEDLLLKRGFMQVDLQDKNGNSFTLINTHYHNPEDGGSVRQEQSNAILEAISGMPRTLLTGDLNAQPGMEEIERLRRSGLRDVLDVAEVVPGYTNPVPEPWRRIDYVWITEDWAVPNAAVPYAEASDHLPVVTSLE